MASHFPARMAAAWQMVLIWGVPSRRYHRSDLGKLTLSAAVVNRWFTQHRGMAMGILTAEFCDWTIGISAFYGVGGGAPRVAAPSC